MAETALDRAHALMEAAPADDAPRLAFFGHLARAELFVLLEAGAVDDTVEPRTFPLEGVPYVVACDTEERLADFAGPLAPWAALSGRTLAPMLAAEGLGLMLNPEVAPSSMVLPPEALAPSEARGGLHGALLGMAEELGAETFVRHMRALQRRPDLQRTLRALKVPVLILGGRHDRLCPPRRQEFMAGLAWTARLILLEEAGHAPTLEAPEAVTAALAAWLDRQAPLTLRRSQS